MAKRGAKRKTSKSFPEGWQEEIIRLGREGRAQHHIYKLLGISQHTFERICRDEPEVMKVFEQFRMESAIFWTDLARDHAVGDQKALANANVLKYNILNRPYIGWHDKQVVEQETTVKADQSATDLFMSMISASSAEGDED